jgi:rSAM/selenodomain-associated transferase 2
VAAARQASAAALSIVIPVLNEAPTLGALLERLRATFPGAELIVVDGGSADGSVPIALPRSDVVLIGGRGRAAQMNLGAHSATRPYLLFLHADCEPGGLRALDAGGLEPLDWGYFPVKLSGRDWRLRVIAWCMNQRARWTHVATGDQGLLVRRSLFLHLGGFAAIPLMEDIEICKRLRRRAPPTQLDPPLRVSSRRWEQRGLLRTVLQMWFLRLAYVLGASPVWLHRRYYGKALRHPHE